MVHAPDTYESHLLHDLPLYRTNSYCDHFIRYGDARTDTENIRSFMGVSATPAASQQIGVSDGDARPGM